jgi:hypothetical protein
MLNRFIIIIFGITIFIFGCESKYSWIYTLPEPWKLSEEEISVLLPKFKEKYPDFEDRFRALTLWRIGTPYDEFKLGEEVPPDTDPLFRLDVSDCTVNVLTNLVLAQSTSWQEARKNITKVHYKSNKDGEHIPNYNARWHFTSDRLLSNPSTVNITNEFIDQEDLKVVELVLNKKSDGTYLLDLDWSKKIQVSYIPNKHINRTLLKKLPTLCGIAFVKESYFKNGLIIGHEGILIDNKSLIHASTTELKTDKINFLEYYLRNDDPYFDGVMIYKFVPVLN